MDASVPSRTRVALVAPHLITRAALRALLESTATLEIVGEGETAADVLDAQPDVVVIDVPPNGDPAPSVSAAASSGHTAVVVLLDEEDLSQCSSAIAAGAAGVVGRRQRPQALFVAIDRVHAGETAIERTLLASVVRFNKNWGAPENRQEQLSKRELEVHALVAEGLRNKEIAERLFISEATVRHHLSSIFGKLGVSGRLELLAAQWRRGRSLSISGPNGDGGRKPDKSRAGGP